MKNLNSIVQSEYDYSYSAYAPSNDINGGIGEININFSDSKDNYKISAKKGIGDLRLDGSSINESESIGNGGTFVKVNGGIGEINIKFNR